MSDGGQTVPRITKAEHIGPNDTGDNIEAKRVAGYIWDTTTSQWVRTNSKTLGTVITATDNALITQTVIHGKTTAGGGSYVDVKVTPSGALVTGSALATDEYGINAISEDATYKYFWFEADNLDYYVMRKHKTTSVFSFTKGTGGYASVYVDEASGPSGSPTWASRGNTF